MKAFAVLDGGGVKGAALAGGLDAADGARIKFDGYGGTSAGSIVALLASIGYSGEEIRDRLKSDVHPLKLLDDDGTLYKSASEAMQEGIRMLKNRDFGRFGGKVKKYWDRHRDVFKKLGSDKGLYDGNCMTSVLLKLIHEKIPELKGYDDPTFQQLEDHGGKQLKIVASDIHARRAVVYEKGNTTRSQSVLQAVRSSACYPFFFKPIVSNGGTNVVDGGLCSNLPVFLFSGEHEKTQLPILAFDLQSNVQPEIKGVLSFVQEIADTAFEASDDLMADLLPGLKHVPIKVPEGIHTLKFDLTDADIESLFNAGRSDAADVLSRWELLSIAQKAGNDIQRELKAYYGPESLFAPVLRALINEVADQCTSDNLRAHIMLPTGRSEGSRIVVYREGFRDDDTDKALELSEFGGCSGKANQEHAPVFADLEEAKKSYKTNWDMTQDQQNLVAKDRKSMFSVPVFAREADSSEDAVDVPVRAILSIDSSTELFQTGWVEKKNGDTVLASEKLTEILVEWAAVVSKLLA